MLMEYLLVQLHIAMDVDLFVFALPITIVGIIKNRSKGRKRNNVL